MTEAIVWCGFFGAWFLVAGPLYQGAIELLEQDQASAEGRPVDLPAPPPPPSVRWWLLPPVMLVLRRRRSSAYRRTVLARLTPEQRAERAGFLHKAAGWFVVATGGTLIAVKETGELVEHYEWAAWSFPLVVVVAFLLACGSTVFFVARRRGAAA